MVIAGDFKVELVDTHTKQPFREHYINGQTYVEVEPDAEYYVSYQRIAATIKKKRIAACLVDGKDLGWRKSYFSKSKTDDEPKYNGSCNFKYDGNDLTKKETALSFSKVLGNHRSSLSPATAAASPRQQHDQQQPSESIMGKVEFQLFGKGQKIQRKLRSHYSEISKSSEGGRGGAFGVIDNSKKQVRSKLSTTSEVNINKSDVSRHKFKRGELLETITLNYCTFASMIHFGILPTGGSTGSRNMDDGDSPSKRRKRKTRNPDDGEGKQQEDKKPLSYEHIKPHEFISVTRNPDDGEVQQQKDKKPSSSEHTKPDECISFEDKKSSSYDHSKPDECVSISVDDDSDNQMKRRKTNGGKMMVAAKKQPTFFDLTKIG